MFRALRRLRLHTRVKRQRQKARSEISVGNDAARAAKSGAVAPRARVLRPGVFCPGEGRGRGAAGWMCREGFGGQSAIVPPTRMIVSLQRRLTARSPLKVSDARPSRSSLMCDSSSVSWYNHAHARRASAHRHRRPSRWLAKYFQQAGVRQFYFGVPEKTRTTPRALVDDAPAQKPCIQAPTGATVQLQLAQTSQREPDGMARH
jgi:hypothetical protein